MFLAEYQKLSKCQFDSEEEFVKFELIPDIYCYTFLQLTKGKSVSVEKELFLKSTFSFMLQVLLTFLNYYGSGGIQSVFHGDIQINLVRLICAFLLHFSIIPEIKIGLVMMEYVMNYPFKFQGYRSLFSFIISSMKITGGILCEVANLLVIVQSQSVGDVIKDFIAFEIIS